MGLMDAIKGLLGGTGVADLAEQIGLGDQVGAAVEAVQQPMEEVVAMQEQVGDAVAPIADAVAPIADAAEPLLP